ncbi:hypothetical protein BVC71_04750 [Marivivens niveibacter]|uniref:AB hydrolase-1 domain-containing protein n=1 Tax=Marivivens niveibacter TaxID=1930667 RepID=A0A251X324_9RHOB|nr:alpha/beta hydrolase [Marivivens niveibacter]OUD10795.1 hypothetical protein BVC71_04750 [Marivivens niveibacter]
MTLAFKIIAYFLTFLAVVAVITYVKMRVRVAGWEREYPPYGHFVMVDGHPVHTVVRGQGPDLVLIHGASGNTRDMEIALGELADRYRLIIFDRPGLGYTPRIGTGTDAGTPREQAALLQAAAAQLGADRPIVLGHSYGGAVGAAWAVYHPENIAGFVDVSGATHPWGGSVSGLYQALSTKIGARLIPYLGAAWVPRSYVQTSVEDIFEPGAPPEGYADNVAGILVARPWSLLANALQVSHLDDALKQQHVGYPDITIPVEVLHGDADTTVYLPIHAEAMAEQVPNANLTVLTGAGHMPHHTHKAQIIAAIDRIAGLN